MQIYFCAYHLWDTQIIRKNVDAVLDGVCGWCVETEKTDRDGDVVIGDW